MRTRYLALLTVIAMIVGVGVAIAASSTSTVKVTARAPRCSSGGGTAVTCKGAYSLATGQSLTISSPAVTPPLPPPPPPVTQGVDIQAYVTGYGWPDNTPPGAAIADPVIHTVAGGTGTYANPITIAVGYSLATGSAVLDYPAGTIFYIPNVRRYFIVEDECGDGPDPQNEPCNVGYPKGDTAWVDVWVGGNGSDNSQVLACEDTLTNSFLIIKNPPSDYVVVPGSLYSDTAGCSAQYGNTPVVS